MHRGLVSCIPHVPAGLGLSFLALCASGAHVPAQSLQSTQTLQATTPVATPAPHTPELDPYTRLTASADVTITGSAKTAQTIEVSTTKGVLRFPVRNERFSAKLPLISNFVNKFQFTALFDGLRSAVAVAVVTRDNEAPELFIDGPKNGEKPTVQSIPVFGRIGDRLSGFKGLTVTVNSIKAEVDPGLGTNGTFFAAKIPLNAPPNTTQLKVVGADVFGNKVTKSVTVKYEPTPPGTPKIEIVSGDAQKGRIQQRLPAPIVVRLLDAKGKPFAGKVVTFEVVRSDGKLSPPLGGAGARMAQVRTDKAGLASALWTLGTDAGCGNNRVSAYARGFTGTVLFCASAAAKPPIKINVGTGNNQVAGAATVAPEPLRAWVNDTCNGVAGVDVTFAVTRGSGKVNGAPTAKVKTSVTGHAEVEFQLGPEPGIQVVEADFPGNPRLPAVFVVTALERGTQATSFSGQVLDNSGHAIGACPIRMTVSAKPLPQVVTDDEGRFAIPNIAETGAAVLHVEASMATKLGGKKIPLGTFPDMMYHPVLVANAANSLSGPIRIPPLEQGNFKLVDNSKDVELTCAGIEGLRFLVKKGSMSIGGKKVGSPGVLVSVNQVHFDEIPMPMPNGASPPFAWTLQPAGSTFDPPVQIVMPNMVGLSPGGICYFLSFDHDAEEFKIVATGSVSEDGAFLVSDENSGISKAGWGGFCPPYPNTGNAGDDQFNGAGDSHQGDSDKKKGTDTGSYSLAELLARLNQVCSGFDPRRNTNGPRPAWSQEATEALFVSNARRIPAEDNVRKNFPREFRTSVYDQVPTWLMVLRLLATEDAYMLSEAFGQHHWWHLPSNYPRIVPQLTHYGWSTVAIRNEHTRFLADAWIPTLSSLATRKLISPWVAKAGAEQVPPIDTHYLETILALEPALQPIARGPLAALPQLPPVLTKAELTSATMAATSTLDVTAGTSFFLNVGSKVQLKVVRKSDKTDLTRAATGTRYFATDGDQVVVVSADGLLDVQATPTCLPNLTPKLLVFAVNGNDFGIGQFAIRDVDTDKDLIVDSFENRVGLAANVKNGPGADADNDGLRDLHECLIGTNPLVTDTDRDGVGDGREVEQGSDPLDPDSRDPMPNRSFKVRVNGQEVAMTASGSYLVQNIPTAANPVRVLAAGTSHGQPAYAASLYFDIRDQRTYAPEPLAIANAPIRTPVRLAATVANPVLARLNEQTRIEVIATMSDETDVDVSRRSYGTRYSASNPDVALVDINGVVAALNSGVSFITSTNEGVSAVVPVIVSLGDPLTTVEGFVQLADDTPVPGATVTVHPSGKSATSDSSGRFTIDGVPALLGDLTLSVEATVNSKPMLGGRADLEPVPTGITDAGIIVVSAGVAWIAGDGKWEDANNWSTAKVPGPTDRVIIDRPGTVTVTLGTGTQAVAHLTCHDNLVLSGGSLAVQFPFQASKLTIAGGLLKDATVFGPVVTATSGSCQNVIFDGLVSVTGKLVARDIAVNGQMTIASSGILSTSVTQVLAGRGEVVSSGGRVECSTGSLTFGPDLLVRGTGTIAGSFTTLGTVRAEGNSLRLAGAWQNQGVLEAAAGGTLNLDIGWHNQGTIRTSGGIVQLNGSFKTSDLGTFERGGGTVQLVGTLDNKGSTFDVSATGDVLMAKGTIVGGTIRSTAGGRLVCGLGYVDAVTLVGEYPVGGNNFLHARNGLTLSNAEIKLDGTAISDLRLERSSLTGTGVVSGGRLARIIPIGNAMIEPGIQITAKDISIGIRGATITNKTPLVCDGLTIRFVGTWINEAKVDVRNGGRIRMLGDNGTNNGVVTATGTSSIEFAPTVGVNNSTLTATGGATLRMGINQTNAWTNKGTLNVIDSTVDLGGTFSAATLGKFVPSGTATVINMIGTYLNQGQTLTLDSKTGSWVIKGRIVGGTLATAEGRQFVISHAVFDGVTLKTDIRVWGTSLRAWNGLKLDNVKVDLAQHTLYASDLVLDGGDLTGTGEVLGHSRFSRFSVTKASKIAAGIKLSGAFTVNCGAQTLTNEGRIEATVPGDTIRFLQSNFVNNSVMEAKKGCYFRMSLDTWTNNKTITIGDSGSMRTEKPWTNTGTITMQSGSVWTTLVAFVQTGGSTTLNGATIDASGLVDIRGGTLAGNGTIKGDVKLAGILDPGGGGKAGVLTVTGAWTQTATGNVKIELGGLTVGTQYDRLAIGGAATFAGNVTVTLLPMFTPKKNDSFDVETFASRTGVSAVSVPTLGGGLKFVATYGTTTLNLSVQ